MTIGRIFLILFLLLNFNIAKGQDDFSVSLKASGQYALLSFKLAPGTKLYWKHPGELGLPSKFSFNNSKNLKNAKLLWPLPEIYTNYNISSYVYQKQVDFPIKITPKESAQDILLELQASFTTCAQTCNSHDLNLSTIIAPQSEMLTETLSALKKIPDSKAIDFQSIEQKTIDKLNWLEIRFIYPGEPNNIKLFLDLPEYAIFNPINYSISQDELGNLIKIPFSLSQGKTSLEYAYINISIDGEKAEYEYKFPSHNDHPFWLILLYALLGGLILNIMPCVLPILGLKLLQITKVSREDNKTAKYELLAQGLGIIFTFIILAVITYFLKEFGIHAGLGMHFQQPVYLITMIMILSLIAMNLLARDEFYLPTPNFIVKLLPTNAPGMIGFFFSGVLACLLATPCTAPFITVAASFALTTSFVQMLTIFIFIGFGMALPYFIIATLPKIAKFLPKPGPWMQKFRKLLGVMILLTSFWMLYVLSTQLGNKTAVILFFLIILIKFVLTENSIKRNAKIITTLVLVSLAYLMPFMTYEETLTINKEVNEVWQEYNPKTLKKLINQGNIIVLDITASWCATCNINKFTTLNNYAVMEYMKKRKIIGMRAYLNRSGDNNPAILELMQTYQHYGVPLNLVYSKKFPKGIILPSILMPHILINAIAKASN